MSYIKLGYGIRGQSQPQYSGMEHTPGDIGTSAAALVPGQMERRVVEVHVQVRKQAKSVRRVHNANVGDGRFRFRQPPVCLFPPELHRLDSIRQAKTSTQSIRREMRVFLSTKNDTTTMEPKRR